MKILLTAINAKYIHSNLAVYSLKAYANTHAGIMPSSRKDRDEYGFDMPDLDIELAEYTINQQMDEILMDIYRRRPDVLCFSCYIWNMEYVESLARELGKLRPDMPVWLGGPEVSYDAAEVLNRLGTVKGVMKGEGEETFTELCQLYYKSQISCRNAGLGLEDISADAGQEGLDEAPLDKAFEGEEPLDEALAGLAGITYRDNQGKVKENPWRRAVDLSSIPFVYSCPGESAATDGCITDFKNKIVYYESSRGCPFSCSYCLSSVDRQLRFRDLEMVKKELQFFIDQEVPQVKFVDRTFNCRHEHSTAIWRYIAKHDRGITNFHFEVAADLLNEEELNILEGMRPGLVQLEIGVQSTNPDTIRAIQRTMDFGRVRETAGRIRKWGSIHQHLDLIAGLPYEDIISFARSFDDVYALKPEQLQLGFLKVLKGSYMEEQREAYGLVYQSRPPYEVLYTRWISYDDMIRLKGIEEMVEIYYNSGQFRHTLNALEKRYLSAFQMYDGLRAFYEKHGFEKVQHKRSARYEILLRHIAEITGECKDETEEFRELLTYDYYLRENARTRPDFAGEYKVPKDILRAFYENEEQNRRYLPAYAGYDRNQMRKMTHLEYFARSGKYILFDYRERNILSRDAGTCEAAL